MIGSEIAGVHLEALERITQRPEVIRGKPCIRSVARRSTRDHAVVRVRLPLDMNISPRWAGYLAVSGHEAVHWSDIGPVTASDDTIMQWARANESADRSPASSRSELIG